MAATRQISCFDRIEDLLAYVDKYDQNDNIEKATFIRNTKSKIFEIMSTLIMHPLMGNMTLPFVQMHETDTELGNE